jgi:D-alanyl-D-alanine carboxypeptidase/D-alanyl-D-alanine-endopeptidase (penicillin-binding protein 4)
MAARTGEEGAFARVLGPRLEQAERAGDAARAAPSLVPAAAGSGLVPAKIR